MSKNRVTKHALGALIHPLALTAAAVLAANALWWQPAHPSWWTGKIGDVAWLGVAPLVMALGIGVVWEWGLRGLKGTKGDVSQWVGLVALAVTGAAFALVKTVPAANALAREAFGLIGVNAKLALDPTDLLALPGLGLAWAAWNQRSVEVWRYERVGVVRRLLALGLAAGALIADSAAPTPMGVVCVGQGGFTLYAVREWSAIGYVNATAQQNVYTSADGGLTWAFSETAEWDPDEGRGLRHWCGDNETAAWPLSDPQDSARQFFFVEGAGIYSTTDGGQTLALEQSTEGLPSGAPSAVFDMNTSNLVVAAGLDGVWVRTGEGWQTVPVGE